MVDNNWFLQIPLADLVSLQGLPGQLRELKAENKQLRTEIVALRNIQTQTIELLGDLRRELKDRR